PKLGLIILDEEHEASFKQEDHFRYHARDAAIILGQIKNIPVILGSATPSLESWHNAQSGKYHLHQMKHRVSGRPLPTIEVIDLKKQEKEASLPFWLSQPLYNKLSESLEKKEQSALFLNRRGMAQSAFCQSCGHVAHCPNCDISLTLHSNKYLVCHYCNYTKGFTEKCPECGENTVNPVGLGTEKVYQDLTSLFPQARITRADRDEIQSREDIENLVSQMEKHQVDILVGTQMIAKGLDFPKLNFVGLVLADVGFNLPDFRSNERNFQLITQVSGRSGRHINEPGQVYIQAYNPQHMSLLYAKNCDYTGFAKKELEHRKELFYPPFSRLGCLRFQGIHLKKVRLAAEQAAQRALQLQQQYPQHYSQIQVLGPAPMPLSKINNKYRYFLLCKSPLTPPLLLQTFFKQLLGDEKWKPTGVSLFIDIDPINLM
ncbi:MAG: primosomal protein N', partial [Bdellovibrio sp.]